MKYILENPVKGKIGVQKYKTSIHWRNGELIADEPKKLGGQDIGPDPHTLLLSSLITCTLATLRMYIDHKGLALPEIQVEANLFHRIENQETTTQIERKVFFGAQVDAELQKRLLRIAEQCPISKLLKGHIKISTAIIE
ncbi:OsmC family peroxiredoxin [Chryseobacterium shandongense]|uniref:OsmC family peroxiredoxin n=1 Tax=Chryseobacterium shandongense TaxID=1493872 RepID=A0AAD1DK37_9FLAO|nr:OsmC family protein [Chryseobacterium shandongense]AZA85502.1 OsmC family peroxiredoxin [Chryseobacterium shandongense]AZA97674.1 OsmC family peroxiredoxin [Chryseobacterium shandongense]